MDEHGRFLGIEGHTGGYVFKEHPAKSKDYDWYDWNVKASPRPVSSAVCRQCRIAKQLSVACQQCDQKMYCSAECCAKDGMHAAECIGPLHRTRMHSHSRFPGWVRAYRHGPFYRPQFYSFYRKWAPHDTYLIIHDEVPSLPAIGPGWSQEQIEGKLDSLRNQHEAVRRARGLEIMPDPVYARFVWVRSGAPRPGAD